MKPVYTTDDHDLLVLAYEETKSCRLAAGVIGCSQSYAHGVLKARGLVPTIFKISDRAAARMEELYVDKGYSLRVVALLMRAEFDPPPCHEAVRRYLTSRGLMRTRSQADRAMNAALTGKDYVALEPYCVELYREGELSQHDIAKLIGISRSTVRRWLAKNGVPLRDAVAVQAQVQRRRGDRTVLRVGELMRQGKTIRETAQRLGISESWVSTCRTRYKQRYL